MRPGSPEWYAEAERKLAEASARAAAAAAERWARMTETERAEERRAVANRGRRNWSNR